MSDLRPLPDPANKRQVNRDQSNGVQAKRVPAKRVPTKRVQAQKIPADRKHAAGDHAGAGPSPRREPLSFPSPEQLVCAMSIAQRRELLQDMGMSSDVHSAALLVTLVKQTRSFDTAVQMLRGSEEAVSERKAG